MSRQLALRLPAPDVSFIPTAVLYKLKLGEVVTTIPTIGEYSCCWALRNVLMNEFSTAFHLPYYFTGFNVETVRHRNISFTVWDVGGKRLPRYL